MDSFRTALRLIGYYPRVLKLMWNTSPRYTLLTLCLTLASSAMPATQVWLSKMVIDRVMATVQAATRGASVNWGTLLAPVALLFVARFLEGLFSRVGSLGEIGQLLDFQVGNHAKYLLAERASQLDAAFFENPAFFDEMDNANREIQRVSYLSSGLYGNDAGIPVAASNAWTAFSTASGRSAIASDHDSSSLCRAESLRTPAVQFVHPPHFCAANVLVFVGYPAVARWRERDSRVRDRQSASFSSTPLMA